MSITGLSENLHNYMLTKYPPNPTLYTVFEPVYIILTLRTVKKIFNKFKFMHTSLSLIKNITEINCCTVILLTGAKTIIMPKDQRVTPTWQGGYEPIDILDVPLTRIAVGVRREVGGLHRRNPRGRRQGG